MRTLDIYIVSFRTASFRSLLRRGVHLRRVQFFPNRYGFGAISSILCWMPIFRQLYGLLDGGAPDYSVLDRELNNRNLFVLPDGIAGVFVSKPGIHQIVFLGASRDLALVRRGIFRLALEHGATAVPIYTSGLSECFSTFNGVKGGWLSNLCRRISATFLLEPALRASQRFSQ